jgi:predicted N-acyltransferase
MTALPQDGVYMEVRIAGSISEMVQKQWDAIAGSSVMSSYGWLKTIEETYIDKILPQIFVITDSIGIVGASVCYIFNKGSVFANFDHVIFGRFSKLARTLKLSFLPALVCSPFNHGSHFLFRKDLDPETILYARDRLIESIEETAKKNRLPVTFINATVEEAQLGGLLQNHGCHKVLDLPLCYLDICWDSFNGYKSQIKSASKNNWKSIKREINKNRKEGVRIQQIEDVEPYEERIHELVSMNIYAHNRLPFMCSKAFYKRLKENLGNDATIYAAVKEGRISGVCICISKGSLSCATIVGIDHEMSGNDCTYFNLAYYRPIMDAIASGKTQINFGRGMYELKRRRGCKVKNIFFYYKPYTVKQKILAKFLFPIRAMWIKKMLPAKTRESLSKEMMDQI